MDIWIALKQQTLKAHENLENHLDALRDDFTLDDLAGLLTSFYWVHRALEEHSQRRSAFPQESQLKKLQRLEVDLKGLDHWPPLPGSFPLAWAQSPEEIFGVLYVMEGSALGGQVLFHHYGNKFGQQILYFHGEGSNTRQLWLDYQNRLGSLVSDQHFDSSKIIHSAVRMFQELRSFL